VCAKKRKAKEKVQDERILGAGEERRREDGLWNKRRIKSSLATRRVAHPAHPVDPK
jgi:hypothetical protein